MGLHTTCWGGAVLELCFTMPWNPGEETVRRGTVKMAMIAHACFEVPGDAHMEIPRTQRVYMVRSMGKSHVGGCFPRGYCAV